MLRPFLITQDEPTPVLADFDAFLAAIEQPRVYLTEKREILDRATLADLDARMRTHRAGPGKRADQHRYPLLHLFQRLCVGARLHRAERQRGKLRMVPTENRAVFGELDATERYFALLEAAWVDLDWRKLGVPDHRCDARLDWLAEQLRELEPGKPVPVSGPFTGHTAFRISGDHVQALALSFFGLLEADPVPASRMEQHAWPRGSVWLRSITVTELGHEVLTRLDGQRPWSLWNTPDRRQRGFGLAKFPGESLRPDDGGVDRPTPFHDVFRTLVPVGSLQRGLPRIRHEHTDCTFVVRASLEWEIWREFALSDRHTLADLHEMIQLAFGFDDDHLYAFYMDGKPHSDEAFMDPRSGELPSAAEARLGDLDLRQGQRIAYLFDFGDRWLFDVDVVEIADRPHRGAPDVLDATGESPRQYPDYAYEDWEDEDRDDEDSE